MRCRQSQDEEFHAARPLWQASPCLAVWHSVGRGARALYGTLHPCQELHVCAVNPGLQISPTVLVYADVHPLRSAPGRLFTFNSPFFFYTYNICVCVCA